MTRRPVLTVVSSRDHDAPGGDQMSFKTYLGVRDGVDPHELRARMPKLWAQYLRERFSCPAVIAASFQVSEQTAYNWLDHRGRPTGDKVLLAMCADPGFADWAKGQLRRAA